jgi:hypothetical protein
LCPRDKKATRKFAALCSGLLVLSTFHVARSANVSVGTHILLPNTALQPVWISVTGGEQIAGEDFYAQVGDGGAYNGGTDTKPSISFATIASNTIFSGNTNGDFNDAGNSTTHPLIWVDGTTTNSGTVSANGSLALLLFDTTNLWSGTYSLKLTGVASSRGSFNTTLRNAAAGVVPLSITNGSLIIGTPIAGDFDKNGVVDAADYVVWRDGLGTIYTQADYDAWRGHFGQTLMTGAGIGVSASVPEPAALLLLTTALAVLGSGRRRAAA